MLCRLTTKNAPVFPVLPASMSTPPYSLKPSPWSRRQLKRSIRSRLDDCDMNNRRPPASLVLFLTLLSLTPGPARAQTAASPGPFLGGVPSGTPSNTVDTITVVGAIARALEHNLGPLVAEEGIGRAQGARWRALAE